MAKFYKNNGFESNENFGASNNNPNREISEKIAETLKILSDKQTVQEREDFVKNNFLISLGLSSKIMRNSEEYTKEVLGIAEKINKGEECNENEISILKNFLDEIEKIKNKDINLLGVNILIVLNQQGNDLRSDFLQKFLNKDDGDVYGFNQVLTNLGYSVKIFLDILYKETESMLHNFKKQGK